MEKLNKNFCVNKYTTALIEESLEEAQRLDPEVCIVQKEAEILVKKRGELTRFCYSVKNGVVYASFKGKRKVRLDRLSRAQVMGLVQKISSLPASELKRKKREGKTFSSGMSRYEFLSLLAQGIDPLTKTKNFLLSKDLEMAIKSLNIFVLRYENIASTDFRIFADEEEIRAQEEKIISQKKARQTVDDRSGTLWTPKEDEQLVQEYMSGMGIECIMAHHNRTRSAIERRLLKLVPIAEIKK